jgi:hypothetical protein
VQKAIFDGKSVQMGFRAGRGDQHGRLHLDKTLALKPRPHGAQDVCPRGQKRAAIGMGGWGPKRGRHEGALAQTRPSVAPEAAGRDLAHKAKAAM